MFTGIIEHLAKITNIEAAKENLIFTLACSFAHEIKVDQSIAHNGVCLTVTSVNLHEGSYTVTAIQETLIRTNLAALKTGDFVNIERCLKLNSLLDGHLVQGHVDTTALCTNVQEKGGSWHFFFEYTRPDKQGYITVEKGSVTVNGVSLTVVDSGSSSFSVAIIPYTFEHTNFNQLQIGDKANIEFDIVGKYIAKLLTNNAYL